VAWPPLIYTLNIPQETHFVKPYFSFFENSFRLSKASLSYLTGPRAGAPPRAQVGLQGSRTPGLQAGLRSQAQGLRLRRWGGVGFGKKKKLPNPKTGGLLTNIHEIKISFHEIIFSFHEIKISTLKFDFFLFLCYNIYIREPYTSISPVCASPFYICTHKENMHNGHKPPTLRFFNQFDLRAQRLRRLVCPTT
jgi:hypothetical protein